MSRTAEFLVTGVVCILLVTSFYNILSLDALFSRINSLEDTLGEIDFDLGSHEQTTENIVQTAKASSPPGGFVMEKDMPIVAVTSEGVGNVGLIRLKVIPGNNNVLIDTNPFLEPDIQYSVNKAVAVAKLYDKEYQFDKDFIFSYYVDAQLVGGESAGAASAALAISVLQNRSISDDVVITGTINSDGTIGEIGGVMEKAEAVAKAGYKIFLVPEGQSKVTYYERQVTRDPYGFGLTILNTRYVPRTIDLKEAAMEEWGLRIEEVGSIEEALAYFYAENA